MSPDWRKPVGMLALLIGMGLWCVAIASLSAWVGRWPAVLQLGFYAAAGVIWITPLKPLLRWMETGRWR